MKALHFGLAAACLAAVCVANAQTTDFTLVPSGATKLIHFYIPHQLAMTSTAPPELKKAPEGLKSPVYGVLKLGPKGNEKSIVVIGDTDKVYADTNGDGDLTNDTPVSWSTKPYKTQKGADMTLRLGTMEAEIPIFGKNQKVTFGAYMFDPNDTDRAGLKNVLLYYNDYALDGHVTLGQTQYHFILDNSEANGDFSSFSDKSKDLLIDVNGNGQFENRGEMFSPGEPFNIGGTTYELSDLATQPKFVKSSKTVAEVATLAAGRPVIPFSEPTVGGGKVNFPGDYKGKVVLLDFWATWCGPCMGEMPNVVKAYKKFHDKGFEILGISFDQPEGVKTLPGFLKEHEMAWKQVADGKFWNTKIGTLYGIDSIPHAYLVDGDTGNIIAEGDEIRGDGLVPAIESALAKKKGAR